MNFHHLEWDSTFFDCKVALIDHKSDTSLTELIPILRNEQYTLAYLFVDPSNQNLNIEARANAGLYVDTRTVLCQDLKLSYDTPTGLEYYKDASAEPELEELAIRSGVFSRFAYDPKIGTNKFEALYRLWLKRSLLKEIASETIVYRHQEKICGFVTMSINTETHNAKIGLIAVAQGMEGMGIGTKLINAVKFIAATKSCCFLEVVTQKKNEAAMKLYFKTGFHVEEELNTYHFWL